jgi:hypothetical protein
LTQLTLQLKPTRLPTNDAVKAQLKANTDAAIAAGVFGVPSMQVDQDVFWGLDALPMLRQSLEGDPWFDKSDWKNISGLPLGVARKTTLRKVS